MKNKLFLIVAFIFIYSGVISQNPGGVTGANLWLKANAGVTPSSGTGTVSAWTDQTGTNTFAVSGDPQTGASTINFNNVVEFDGNGDYLTGNASITFQTLYAVIKRNNTDFASTVMSVSTSASNIGYIMKGNNLATGNNNGAYFQSTGSFGTDKARLGVVEIVAGATATGNKTYIDGLSYSTQVLSLDGTFNPFSDVPYIGRSQRDIERDYFNGQIAELIMYGASHTDAPRRQIESYLAIKYGITLDVAEINYLASDGSTVLWDNTTYWNDVFGIGQDDGSGLDQTSSNSINTGSGDGTGQSGLGNIVLSNASSQDDDDFLLIGHNNAALTEQSTDLPASLATHWRLAREWKAAHTNDIGTADLTFSTLGLTLTGTTASDFILIIDEDGDGDFTTGTVTEVVANSYSSNIVSFSGVTLGDDDVFTMITGESTPGGVSGANLWYRADAGVTTGTSFTWSNQGSLGTDADATATGTDMPTHTTSGTNQMNFNPAVLFDGTEYLQTPVIASDILGTSGSDDVGTQFAVVRASNLGNKIFYQYSPNNIGNFGIYMGSGNTNLVLEQQGKTIETSFSGLTSCMLDLTASTNGSTPTGDLHLNGVSTSTSFSGSYGDYSAGNRLYFAHFNSTSYQVDISEMILFPSVLSSTDRSKVQTYLGLKYGISLGNNSSAVAYTSSTGATIWAADATYKYDIFGIGIDAGSGLSQTSSNSINSGTGDGTGQSGKGNIVLSSASDLTDGEFLIVGHDNGTLGTQYSDLPSSVEQARLGREWKVERTGDPGTVTLTFEFDGITLGGSIGIIASDFNILIDSDGDGDFSNATATNASSVSGTLITYNGLTLPDGAVFTFSYQLTKTFRGTTDELWSRASNWSPDALPDASGFDNVLIQNITNDPVINYNNTATIKNLTIESGGQLTIESISLGTGSLIIYGTLTNNGTIISEQHLTGEAQAWHMIGAPIAGGIAANGWNPTAGQDDFYAWDEPTPGTWVNYDNTGTPSFTTVNGGMNFVPGKGYLVAYNLSNPTKYFTGTLTTGDVLFQLKNSQSKAWTYANGWNLMANPYSSAIDWNLATRTQFADNFAYAYDPNKSGGEGYVQIDGSSANAYIAPHQAFFVQALPGSNNQNFTFSNAIQAHGGTNYKSTNLDNGLVLRLTGDGYYDETRIRIREESEDIRDRNDAMKLYSFNSNVPQVYTVSSDNAYLAVNSIPDVNTEKEIKLGTKIPKDGAYTITLEEIDDSMLMNGLYIENLNDGSLHKLGESSYSFNAVEGDHVDLVIHFGIVGVDEEFDADNKFRIYSTRNNIVIDNIENQTGEIRIYNLQGQLIARQQLTQDSKQQVALENSGIHIVALRTNNNVITKKVITSLK